MKELPIRGQTLDDWFDSLSRADIDRISSTVVTGLLEESPIEDIDKAVRGTRKNDYKDGVSETGRGQLEGVISTVGAAAASAIAEETFKAQSGRVDGLVWVSVLDTRTSAICRDLDGRVAPLLGQEDTLPSSWPRLDPPGKRPPAHFRCRSRIMPIVDGKRPRETTYEEWLRKQPAKDQKEILGAVRYRLLTEGKLDFGKLYKPPSGTPLTIAELKSRESKIFEKLGL